MLNIRKTLVRAFAAAALAAASLLAGAAQPQDPKLPGEVLMRLRSTSALAPLLARHGLTLKAQFGARPIYEARIADGSSVDQKVKQLELDADVVAAEANRVHSAPEARKNLPWLVGTASDYVEQWAPDAMHLPAAQKIATGAGVRVAVLDTGVDASHPLLAGKLLPGRDFVDGDMDPSETGTRDDLGYGHGTHVAGLVALAAPGARIVPIRVLDASGHGNVWVLADALLYALDPDGNPATDDGAHVVNISLGTLQRTRIVDAAMQLAACTPDLYDPLAEFGDAGYDGDKARCNAHGGAVIVAAAGNGGNDKEEQYPAAEGVYGLIPVGATRPGNRIAKFSNRGSWVDVAAPGDGITSSVPGGGYGTWSGTSMATPLVAGTAALLRQRFPAMEPKDVAKRIEDTGRELCNANIVQVDALAALKNKRPPDCR